MNLTYEEIPSESYAIKKALRAYIALRRKRNLSLMRPAAGGVFRKRNTFLFMSTVFIDKSVKRSKINIIVCTKQTKEVETSVMNQNL